MNKIINKIKNNKILYIIFVYIILLLFMCTIKCISIIFENMTDLNIFTTSKYEKYLIKEIIYILIAIPIIFLFKKQKIYKESKINFINTIKLSWPIFLMTIIYLFEILINVKNTNLIDIIVLLLFCINIGILEESLFKGVLFNSFLEKFKINEKNAIKIIIMCSLTFGLMHLFNYNGQNLKDVIQQSLQIFLMDIGILTIYYRSKNIYVPIFYHTIYDFNVNLISGSSVPLKFNIILAVTSLIFISIPYLINAILIYNDKDTKLKKGLKIFVIIYLIFIFISDIIS